MKKEMKRMLALDVKIIGINNRNLKTFEVNLETTKKLSDMVTDDMRKAGKLLVSESGVSDTDDIKLLAKSRADALLIGTVLMELKSHVNLYQSSNAYMTTNVKKKNWLEMKKNRSENMWDYK